MIDSRPATPRATVPIPRELLRAIPRTVQLTGPGKFAAGAAWALLASAAVSGIWLTWRAARDQERHAAFLAGFSAQAHVVRMTRTGGEHPRRVVVYEYQVGDRSFDGRTTLSKRDRTAYPIGSVIPIRYLSAEPGASCMRGYEPRGVSYLAATVVPPLLALGALPIGFVLRRQRHLSSSGRPAVATVKSIRPFHDGQRRRHRIGYEYRILSGAVRAGSFEVARNPPAPGSLLIVIYDRENTRKSAPYPLSLVRAV